MDEHGLEDWTLELSRAVNQFGLCSYGSKKISLSAPLATLNGVADVRDVILHEVAHAKAGFKAGHGPEWKSIALSIGCNASRTHSAVTPPDKFRGTCLNCGNTMTRNRRSKRTACAECCNAHNNGLWSDLYLIVWTENVDKSYLNV